MAPWTKRGLVFAPDGSSAWMRSHAAPPVVEPRCDVLRVYFSSRDPEGRARLASLDVAADDPGRVVRVGADPLLPLGKRGTFDDNGTSPCSLVRVGDRRFLYYIGWNPQVTVSYRLGIGLAVSDGDGPFRRLSDGPILDRDADEPFFNTTPWVLRDGGRWRMWYSSCTGWEEVDGRPEPRYLIRHAESDDGVRWRRTGHVCIGYDADTEAVARPCVVVRGGAYHMWYSYRRTAGYRTDPAAAYRLGYAVSADGLSWDRRDAEVGLSRSADGWDSEMIAYAHVLECGGRWLCFYNGNGFGRTGFGYAERAA